jgi:hypothetical protein
MIKFLNYPFLDHLSAPSVYRVRNVGVELCSPSGIMFDVVRFQLATAMIAEARSKMIFSSTFIAIRCKLPAWHRDERPVITFDDFQVSNDETIVKRDTAKTS